MSVTLKYPQITHDHFFKKLMERPEVVREFFEEYLPQGLVVSINLDTITRLPTEMKGHTKDTRFVDAAFKVNFNEEEGHVVILVEHQRTPDWLMPLRIMEYTCHLHRQSLGNKKSRRRLLPLIYPLVIYQNKHPYPYFADIRGLVAGPRLLVERYFLKPFQLIDLATIPDSRLKRKKWSGAMLLALKHVLSENPEDVIGIFDLIKPRNQQDNLQELLEFMVEYVTINSVVEDAGRLAPMLSEKLHQITGDTTMGQFADALVRQGMQQGMQQGMRLGVQQGVHEVARKMLEKHKPIDEVRDLTGLDHEDIEKLIADIEKKRD